MFDKSTNEILIAVVAVLAVAGGAVVIYRVLRAYFNHYDDGRKGPR